jgi:hypothetical protein
VFISPCLANPIKTTPSTAKPQPNPAFGNKNGIEGFLAAGKKKKKKKRLHRPLASTTLLEKSGCN